MKNVFLTLVFATFFFSITYAQSGKKKIGNATSPINILTDDEIEKLDRKNSKTITINYESDVDLDKEVTAKEYYTLLRKTKYQPSDEKAFGGLREVFRRLSGKAPDHLMKIPREITVLSCGGCGCVTPGKAGYALCVGNTCWCDCCP